MDIVYAVLLFIHIAGIIIALGAINILVILLINSRKDMKSTTLFLDMFFFLRGFIWTGAALMILSWLFMLQIPVAGYDLYKSLIMIALGANGCYMTFLVSPKIRKHTDFKKGELLPMTLKDNAMFGLTMAVVGWWAIVAFTVLAL